MISQPGLYTIPMAEYLADPCETPSLTASIANTLLTRSPAHARMQHPRLFAGFEREDDSRFELGSAAHALLLEDDGGAIEFIAANDWRTNAAKDARNAARAAGKLPVLSRYEGVLTQMVKVAREAIERSEFIGIWSQGKPEQTMVWQEDGVWLRARPDFMRADRTVIIDYKTSDSAEPEFFIRQIGRMGYDVSAAFYVRGVDALPPTNDGATQDHNGQAYPAYVWLAQEIEPPFACSLVTLGKAYLEIADEKVDRAIALWRMCLASDKWPAYSLSLHYAEPSSWQMSEFEARMNREEW